jgi:hypothetical protein
MKPRPYQSRIRGSWKKGSSDHQVTSFCGIHPDFMDIYEFLAAVFSQLDVLDCTSGRSISQQFTWIRATRPVIPFRFLERPENHHSAQERTPEHHESWLPGGRTSSPYGDSMTRGPASERCDFFPRTRTDSDSCRASRWRGIQCSSRSSPWTSVT